MDLYIRQCTMKNKCKKNHTKSLYYLIFYTKKMLTYLLTYCPTHGNIIPYSYRPTTRLIKYTGLLHMIKIFIRLSFLWNRAEKQYAQLVQNPWKREPYENFYENLDRIEGLLAHTSVQFNNCNNYR